MIEYREGVTDWNHLMQTILDHTTIKCERRCVEPMIVNCLERCVECWLNNKLIGYALVLKVNGERSFHGYKLIPGHAFESFQIAKRFIDEYPGIIITTTLEKKEVRRLGHLLGMHEELRGDIVCLRR